MEGKIYPSSNADISGVCEITLREHISLSLERNSTRLFQTASAGALTRIRARAYGKSCCSLFCSACAQLFSWVDAKHLWARQPLTDRQNTSANRTALPALTAVGFCSSGSWLPPPMMAVPAVIKRAPTHRRTL